MPRNANVQEQAEGYDAAALNQTVSSCPYIPPAVEWGDWATGYRVYFEDRLRKAKADITLREEEFGV